MAVIGFIVLGDRTSHGGTVISADPTWTIDGQPVARVGDKVSCSRCRRTSTIVTSRFPTMIDNGQAVAFDQDRTDCGAILYSRHNGHAGHDDGQGAQTAPLWSTPEEYTPAKALRFEEHFILKDSATGQPLAEVPYTITTSDGLVIDGATDSLGRTAVVWTEGAQPVTVVAKPKVKQDDPYHLPGEYAEV